MTPAEGIAKLGFRSWYERQLIESFGYLTLAFVALVLLLAGFEVLSGTQSGPNYLLLLAAAAAGGMLMLVAWRRFHTLLIRAEHFAEAATSPHCKAWGKFNVIAQESAHADDPPEAGRPHWLSVRCTKCASNWRIE